jgi:hypothetical protein
MHAPDAGVLDARSLNRATLARQHLLDPSPLPVEEEIEHLVGMQSQVPTDPYVALWNRYDDFRPDELSQLMLERRAVRMTLMRGTIHLVTARDALRLRVLLQPMLERLFHHGTPFARRLAGLDLDAVLAAGRRAIEERARSGGELRRVLAEEWPDADAEAMVAAIKYLVPVVQVPPRGVWGGSMQPTFTTLDSWLGAPLDRQASLDDVVLRYLAAFGPATVLDAQNWSRLTRLREVFEGLRPRLVAFRDTWGRELFDVPEAPRPDPDTPVPTRMLPTYDNVLLGHDDRSRFAGTHDVRGAFSGGLNFGAVLVDGLVAGSWRPSGETTNGGLIIAVRVGRPLTAVERTDVEARGHDLGRFLRPDARTVNVTFEAA